MEFRCQVHNYTSYGLEMFVGESARIFSRNVLNHNFIGNLHRGELSAMYEQAGNCTTTSCEGVGTFWMVANSRTLPLMDYFWCRASHNGQHEDSIPAFIVDVLYPECDDRTFDLVTTSKPVRNVTTTCTSLNTIVRSGSGSQNIYNCFIFCLSIIFVCVDVMFS